MLYFFKLYYFILNFLYSLHLRVFILYGFTHLFFSGFFLITSLFNTNKKYNDYIF